MESKVQATYKSNDTEEWLDKVWTRPIGYLWAKFFQALGVHPNVVTVLSMIIGASASLFFYHGSFHYEGTHGLLLNCIGVLLLAWANFYDSADGQLARMTGKKTQLGRILDGAASEVWFIPIYLALVVRFYHHHSQELSWLGIQDSSFVTGCVTLMFLALVLYSGFHGHSIQCSIADYYRQIHLLFLKGKEGSELDNSAQQERLYRDTPWKGNFCWKVFMKTYINYTHQQELRTPWFQMMYRNLLDKYHSIENTPLEFRERFREKSLPLMKFTNLLTFNTRAIMLYLCCLADIPWLYFIFETVVMGCICKYMVTRHEWFCAELMQSI